MEILPIMIVGVLIGRFIFPENLKSLNEKLQIICTLVLIFAMGVMLGKRENFLAELSTLGVQSLVFCLIPVIFSIILVYVLTRRFLSDKNTSKEDG